MGIIFWSIVGAMVIAVALVVAVIYLLSKAGRGGRKAPATTPGVSWSDAIKKHWVWLVAAGGVILLLIVWMTTGEIFVPLWGIALAVMILGFILLSQGDKKGIGLALTGLILLALVTSPIGQNIGRLGEAVTGNLVEMAGGSVPIEMQDTEQYTPPRNAAVLVAFGKKERRIITPDGSCIEADPVDKIVFEAPSPTYTDIRSASGEIVYVTLTTKPSGTCI